MLRAVLAVLVLCATPVICPSAQASSTRADTTSSAARIDSTAADTSATNNEREGGQCFRFMFGEWKPPLDAKAAGHGHFPPADSLPQAPGGRDWAFSDSTTRDIQLMLYPSFWPAGVVVRFPHVPHTADDTVRGRAMALVADGRVESPEADAMAWLVPCAGERSAR